MPSTTAGRPARPPKRIVRRVPARVGLAGNPSDLHRGAVLALPIPELLTTVEVTVDPGARGPVELRGPGVAATWPDLGELRAETARTGHRPETGIITASLLRCLAHLGGVPSDGAWRIEWATQIPRSVGLAGSSALAVGVIEAVAAARQRVLDPLVVAALALAAEVDELGIVAGWQDRVVQAVRAPVLVDTACLWMLDGLEVPTVELLEWPADLEPDDPHVVIGWRSDAAEDSGAHHARRPAGPLDESMARLAEAAHSGARSLIAGDPRGLERAVRRTWSIRSEAVPLRADHGALVECLVAMGVAATTPGSGGSVVGLLTDGHTRDAAVAALDAVGADRVISRVAGRWSTS